MALRCSFHSGEVRRCYGSLGLFVISGIEGLALDTVARSEIDSEKVGDSRRDLLGVERTVIGSLSSGGDIPAQSHQPGMVSPPDISPVIREFLTAATPMVGRDEVRGLSFVEGIGLAGLDYVLNESVRLAGYLKILVIFAAMAELVRAPE